jgi:hypothetical protein
VLPQTLLYAAVVGLLAVVLYRLPRVGGTEVHAASEYVEVVTSPLSSHMSDSITLAEYIESAGPDRDQNKPPSTGKWQSCRARPGRQIQVCRLSDSLTAQFHYFVPSQDGIVVHGANIVFEVQHIFS